jgi:hypothetical protein
MGLVELVYVYSKQPEPYLSNPYLIDILSTLSLSKR